MMQTHVHEGERCSALFFNAVLQIYNIINMRLSVPKIVSLNRWWWSHSKRFLTSGVYALQIMFNVLGFFCSSFLSNVSWSTNPSYSFAVNNSGDMSPRKEISPFEIYMCCLWVSVQSVCIHMCHLAKTKQDWTGIHYFVNRACLKTFLARN